MSFVVCFDIFMQCHMACSLRKRQIVNHSFCADPFNARHFGPSFLHKVKKGGVNTDQDFQTAMKSRPAPGDLPASLGNCFRGRASRGYLKGPGGGGLTGKKVPADPSPLGRSSGNPESRQKNKLPDLVWGGGGRFQDRHRIFVSCVCSGNILPCN